MNYSDDSDDNSDENSDRSRSDSDASQDEYSTYGVDWRIMELHPHSCVQSREDGRRMRRKLRSDPYSLNRPQETESFEPPLHVAVYCQHANCVSFLIDEGADVNRMNQQGHRPLEKAVEKACTGTLSYIEMLRAKKIIQMLLQHGATINYEGRDHESTYFLSQIVTQAEDHDLLKLFLEYGAETEDWEAIHQGELYYETPLYSAMTHGDVTASRLLFLYGAEIDLQHCPHTAIYLENLKPIPHCLIDKFRDTEDTAILNILKLYREFGGSFNVLYKGLTPEQHADAKHIMLNQENDAWIKFVSTLKHFSNTPLTLLSLSRLVIRKCLGRELRENVKNLPLPRELHRALKFKLRLIINL